MSTKQDSNIKKVTPVRIVDRVEPCLRFWCDALGYTKKVEVPHEDTIGFAILEGAGGELMFQSRASVAADLPAVAKRKVDTLLYIEVRSLEKAIASATAKEAGAEIIVPKRTTFYGAHEVGIVDPQGTVVLFAESAEKA